jgi:hypothetical protein
LVPSFCACVIPGPTYNLIGARHALAAGSVIKDDDIEVGEVQEYRHLDHGYRLRLRMNFPTERSQVIGHTLLRPIEVGHQIYFADISPGPSAR